MAENDDIPKGAADNLQKAAQSLALISKSLEKTFSKGGDFASAMSREVNKVATGAKTTKDYFDGIKDLNKDLAAELEQNAKQQEIQNLALATGNSIAVATLSIEKEKAILQAREQGLNDSIISKLEDKYNAAIQMTTELERQNAEAEAAADLAAENEKHTEALKDKLKEITGYQGVFSDIFTDGRLAAGIFLNQVNKGMKNMTGLFDHARHEGHTVSQAFHETGVAISDSFSLTGTSAKDSMEVMSGMRAEMGNLEGVTREARLEAASLAKTYGISNEEAGKLTAQMAMMPGASLETANNNLKFAGSLAKAAGVAPGEVMKDMAKNGENVAKFGKDGGKNMAVMAVAAKKVGVEMGVMAAAAEGLLDFENSIEKQMEASVLLGREINLDKARQAALNGDLVGATKEMLAQVGGEAEFNKMNVVQRKALADSYGVSVADMSKMVKNQDKLNDLTEEQQEALANGEVSMDELMANAGGFYDKMKGVAVTTFSLVKGFSTLSKGAKDVAEFGKMIGIQGFQQLKDTVKLGIEKTRQFAANKAALIYEFLMGKKLSEQAKNKIAGSQSVTKKGQKAAKDAAGKLKKDGTPDMRFKDNKGADKALKGAEKSTDKAGDMNKKAAKQSPLAGFKTAMRNLRMGIAEFGKQPGKTLKGVLVLVAAGALLGIGLASIGMAVKAMGGSPKDMIEVGLALVLFAGSMFLMSKSLGKMPVSAVIKGALAMGILALALIPAAFAFSLLKGVDIGSIIAFSIALPLLALAAAGLGFLAPFIMAGSLALAILGAAIIPAALAFQLLGDVDPSIITNFAAGILVLAGTAALLGFLIIPMMLGSIAIALLSASLVVLGVGLMAITAGLPGIDALSTLLSMMAEQGMAAAGGLLATGGAMFIFSGALLALAFASFFGAPALILLAGAMLVLGTGVALAAGGFKMIAEALPLLADGAGALGASMGVLAIAGGFLLSLGVASLIAAPGLFVGAAALGFMAVSMGAFAAAVTMAIPGVALLLQLGSMADAFASISASMFTMAAGIAAFATAGLLTLPTIMGLIALSFVAPILTLLGDSINYDLNGGGSSVQAKPEDSKMDVLIEEIRQLRAAFQTPGVINMDGQKVGDVIGLAVSTSGVS